MYVCISHTYISKFLTSIIYVIIGLERKAPGLHEAQCIRRILVSYILGLMRSIAAYMTFCQDIRIIIINIYFVKPTYISMYIAYVNLKIFNLHNMS